MIDFIRKLIINDFWLKLFSLGLAVLIWLTVDFFARGRQEGGLAHGLSGRPEQQRVYRDVPVMVMSSAADVRSVKVAPSKVDVVVQGDPDRIDQVPDREIHAIVDLTGTEAAHDLRQRIEVTTPRGVRLVSVEPPEVQVIFPPAAPAAQPPAQ